MSDLLEYKGYQGTVSFDCKAGLFHGEIMHLKDVVTFQGTTVEELSQAFKDSIDDYLDFCAERGEAPDKPYSGKFLVRVKPELHRKLATEAAAGHTSLNSLVEQKLGASEKT